MNPLKELKSSWLSIPVEVQQFLKRTLVIFIIWKLTYHLFLFNGRILDKPLTDFSARGAAQIMRFFYPKNQFWVKQECSVSTEFSNDLSCLDFLFMDGKKLVGVADLCNALELYILYIGFLLAFPASIKKVLLFAVIGIVVIYMANIIRLAALSYMNMHRIDFVDIAHHYLFKMIVYALIFGLWVLFTRKQLQNAKTT